MLARRIEALTMHSVLDPLMERVRFVNEFQAQLARRGIVSSGKPCGPRTAITSPRSSAACPPPAPRRAADARPARRSGGHAELPHRDHRARIALAGVIE
ncbi:hypothetical protein, partial [Azospirillum formosense]|uniref:hypothetical protein n=1 Tax=Azospirillum formosense TaxID=861533 RepID=UPI001C9211B5